MDAAPENSPFVGKVADALGETLTGLPAMAEVVRRHDTQKVWDCKEDMDTLLVFAGLFSAVLSSFLVATYPGLQQPDSEDRTLAALERIASQTASYRLIGGYLNSTTVPSSTTLPGPTTTDIYVNAFWFASLILSLSTASFAMLVKQWLREFLDIDGPIPQARLRVRHFRFRRIATWKVYEIAAVLPLLLQVALGLFFVGLCFLTVSLHPTIERTTIPLVAGWAFCFLTCTFIPILFPHCPYKTALLQRLFRYLLHVVYPRLCAAASAAHDRAWAYWWTAPFGSPQEYFWRLLIGLFRRLHSHYQVIDEGTIAKDTASDMQILTAVDSIRCSEMLLRTAIQEWVVRMKLSLLDTLDLIRHLLETRLQWAHVESLQDWMPMVFDSKLLHSDASGSLLTILDGAIAREGTQGWANRKVHENEVTTLAFMAVTSLSTSQPLPPPTQAFMVTALEHYGTQLCACIAEHTLFDTSNPEDPDVLFEGLTSLVVQLDTSVTHTAWLRCFEAVISVRLGRSASPVPRTPFHGWTCEDVESIEWNNVISTKGQSGVKYLLAVTRSAASAAILPGLLESDLSQPLRIALMMSLCACSKFDSVEPSIKEEFGAIWSMALGSRQSADAVIDIWLNVPFDWVRSHPLSLVNSLYGNTFLNDLHLMTKESNLLAVLQRHSDAVSSTLDDASARNDQFEMVASLSKALRLCCIAVRLVYMPSATLDPGRDQWTALFESMLVCQVADGELLSLFNLLDENSKLLVAKCLDSMQLLETKSHLWDLDPESLKFESWRNNFNPANTVFPDKLFKVLANLYTKYEPWRLRYLREEGGSKENIEKAHETERESLRGRPTERSRPGPWATKSQGSPTLTHRTSFHPVQYHPLLPPPRRAVSMPGRSGEMTM